MDIEFRHGIEEAMNFSICDDESHENRVIFWKTGPIDIEGDEKKALKRISESCMKRAEKSFPVVIWFFSTIQIVLDKNSGVFWKMKEDPPEEFFRVKAFLEKDLIQRFEKMKAFF